MEALQVTSEGCEGNVETIEYAIRSCERSTGTKHRSFFLKRLEQHLVEKGLKIPELIFDLFDTPFEDFTPEYKKVYEEKVKGQALFHIFSDMLIEIYEKLQADRIGWETSANFLEDTPMKVCALHALARIQQLEELPEEQDDVAMAQELTGLFATHVTPQEQKLYAKPYIDTGKGRRRKRAAL